MSSDESNAETSRFNSPRPYGVFARINALCLLCNERVAAAGWWTTTLPVRESKAVKLALMHSELSECLEAVRKDAKSEHLPQSSAEEEELADLLIRVFDYAGQFGLDLGTALQDKLEYNLTRADHSPEARQAPGGKKF